MARFVVTLFILLSVASLALAQNDPAAGILPFSTNSSGAGVDSLDLASSNLNIDIPMRARTGLAVDLIGNSHIYKGGGSGQLFYWALSGLGGLVYKPKGFNLGSHPSASEGVLVYCKAHYEAQWTILGVYDATGALHPVPHTTLDQYGCNGSSATLTTDDNSGFTIVASDNGGGLTMTAYDANGTLIQGNGTGGFTATTLDGNSVSYSVAGANFPQSLSFTDLLGTVMMTGTFNGGTSASGTGNPDTYSYTDANGYTDTFTVNYTKETVTTHFNCSGIQDITSNTYYLPTSVVFTSNHVLQFQYTISYESSGSGTTTGRISQITLPAGGYVKYGYSGINCNSGVVPTLTRTVNDNNGNSGTWTYVNSNNLGPLANYTVTETDPAGNQTVYSFAGEFQTAVEYYQGSATGTPLKTLLTCYNGNTNNCQAPSNVPSFPMTETDIRTTLNTSPASRVTKALDFHGNVTAVSQYDFGGTLTSPTGVLLSTTANVFGQSYSSPNACNAYPSGTYIYDTPCYSYTNSSAGTTVAQTQITYSSTGHPTTTKKWVSGSTWLTASATYGTNGAAAGVRSSMTDFNGATTTFGNFTCNGMIPTSTTLPQLSGESFQMSTSQTYDCNGGVVTRTEDANGNYTTYSYNDPLWRLTSTTRPDGGSTSITYNTVRSLPWTVSSTTVIDSGGQSFTNKETLDGLGRTVHTNTTDPNYSGGHTVDTVYNSLGQVYSISNPYFTTSDPTYGVTTYSYDALSRVTNQHDPGGFNINVAYSGRASQVTYYPYWVNKSTITQVDGRGRAVQLCEVTNANQMGGSGTPASCGLDIAGTGFMTTYSYDALDNPTQISQMGLPNRTYGYDGLSRLISESNPESGAATYTYDGSGLSGNNPAQGDLYQRIRNGVTTTYTYDLLHRVIQNAYSDTTIWSDYNYDGYDVFNGSYDLITNGKGQRTSTWTCCVNGQNQTADSFSYDSMGRVLNAKEQMPSGNVYQLPYTYNYVGDVKTQSNGTFANYTNTYNALGQLTSISTNYLSSTESGTIANGFTYNALGEVTYDVLGNGLTETYKYDITGKPNWFSLSGGSYQYGTNASHPNTWVGKYLISSGDNLNGNWNYSYDNFGRLSGANCVVGPCPAAGTGLVDYAYAYDRYGNRWQENLVSGTGLTTLLTFNSNNQVSSNTYDALGNVTHNGLHSYAYDAENRVTNVDNGATTYVYDALGRGRTSYSNGSYYEAVLDLQGNTVSSVHGGTGSAPTQGRIFIAGRDWGFVNQGSSMEFMHTDWLGNGRAWTSLSGSVYQTCQNLPFGDAASCAYNNYAEAIFAGLWVEPEYSQAHAQFRQLDLSQAHWTTTDPAGRQAADPTSPQSWNRYAYVMNNPLSFIDPTGLACWPFEKYVLGSCAGFMSNGIDFWGSFNEFDLMNIPVVSQNLFNIPGQPTWVPNPNYDENDLNSIMGTFVTSSNWVQVGTGFDLQSSSWWSAANNGNWLQRGLNYLKTHPVFISFNEIVALQLTVKWSTKTVCGNWGAGASVPPTKMVTVGVYNEGNMNNWTNVLSSSGYSFGANLGLGYQASTNSSGTIGGPTVSGVGLSGSYTFGACGGPEAN